ncbi:hypothetical protein BVG16_21765 [Paenibacillus selenitireducens]|uniref:Uncharacterized protein n=1 Tax=Paenibacillus selenitireducens TaxID=1324314 RepID=A0A1T2X5R8_9BACL|nr:hypothetical protein [Paenibacillus selenitireducens]OPA75229.1 hypothetical protein BVG16_21765 [Paenibacillus selenitireducens]
MGAKILDSLCLTDQADYIDVMHAILKHRGWMTCSRAMLSGMTVSSFRFTVHRRLTAESTTAYNWMAEHFLAADFVGITASQAAGFQFEPTFPLYQKQAISDIKRSIDRGIGAVIWKDQFVIVVGYDDERKLLYYADGTSPTNGTLPYIEWGRNRSPYWYYQVFEERLAMDELAIYRESLLQAIYKWETHDLMLPESDYACGRAGYDAMADAMHSSEYDGNGVCEIIRYYASAKKDIYEYTTVLQKIWPELKSAVEAYDELAQIFETMVEMTLSIDATQKFAAPQVRTMIHLLMNAKQKEETAIEQIKILVRETINNRFNDIGLR